MYPDSQRRLVPAQIRNLDPERLADNLAFAQGAITPAARTLCVGGQLGTDHTGKSTRRNQGTAEQTMRATSCPRSPPQTPDPSTSSQSSE